jgi:mannan endo-1,4-beta-mannosidase
MQHDAIGASAAKPVILEEYGSPFPHSHIGTVGPWQATVLNSNIAADQIWQFGPAGTSVSPASISDVNTILYNDTEYAVLGKQHAKMMLQKEDEEVVGGVRKGVLRRGKTKKRTL